MVEKDPASALDPEPPVAFLHTGHSRMVLRRAAVQCLKLP